MFSFTRSYFHVECRAPAALVAFLKTLMPKKPVGELYTALGFNKHGKTELYRDLLRHLASSDDRFVEAPGAAGMVMLVFTLPSYDVVFKVIRDSFAPAEDGEPAGRARQVPARLSPHARGPPRGRPGVRASLVPGLALRLPAPRAAPRRSREDRRECAAPRSFSITSSRRRRLTPLDIFLRDASAETARAAAIVDFGEAIRDLAKANIFPGDLLPKNFGLTRHGRVVFYDYDEICFLTDVNFRELPAGADEESSNAEPSFCVGRGRRLPRGVPHVHGPQRRRPARPSSSGTPTSSACGSGSTPSGGSAPARSSTSSRTRPRRASGPTELSARERGATRRTRAGRRGSRGRAGAGASATGGGARRAGGAAARPRARRRPCPPPSRARPAFRASSRARASRAPRGPRARACGGSSRRSRIGTFRRTLSRRLVDAFFPCRRQR